MNRIAIICAALALAALPPNSALSHEWYSGLHGKDGQLCCGADDCEPTVYQERRGEFYFFTREKHWVRIPSEKITFLPVPGDEADQTHNRAHLCYRPQGIYDNGSDKLLPDDAGGFIFLYCAFIAPGAI